MIIPKDDARYPSLLKEIHDPPGQLYVRGNAEILQVKNLLAVVGTRRANYYGRQAVEKLLVPAVRAGVVLVSGLAYGIDSLAHKACLDWRRPTIAVLGSGADDESLYPRGNLNLAHQILEHGGALVTEHLPGTKALLHHFPIRNRIIAGLCRATVIIQAAQKSGSLITARLALESNRDVAAVPGPITDPLAEGTNSLIRDGATPLVTSDDTLRLVGLAEAPAETQIAWLTPPQQQLAAMLSHQPQHVDELTVSLNLPAEQVSTLLVELELSGVIEHVGGMKYVKK